MSEGNSLRKNFPPFQGIDSGRLSYAYAKHKLLIAYLNNHFVGKNVLDIGCGKNKLGSIGIDFGVNDNADFVVDLQTVSSPFPDYFFDCVVLSDVLEHLEKPASVLGDVKRILREGGEVLITIPNSGNPLFKLGLWNQDVKTGNPHVQFWTDSSFRQFLDENGFTVEEFIPTYYAIGNGSLFSFLPGWCFCLFYRVRKKSTISASESA